MTDFDGPPRAALIAALVVAIGALGAVLVIAATRHHTNPVVVAVRHIEPSSAVDSDRGRSVESDLFSLPINGTALAGPSNEGRNLSVAGDAPYRLVPAISDVKCSFAIQDESLW